MLSSCGSKAELKCYSSVACSEETRISPPRRLRHDGRRVPQQHVLFFFFRETPDMDSPFRCPPSLPHQF